MNPVESPTSWYDRLTDYLQRLTHTANQLQQTLVDLSQRLNAPIDDHLPAADTSLPLLLLDLEHRMAERAELIHACDTPASGSSLQQIITRSNPIERDLLLQQCDTASQALLRCREQAIASFACQYHLADFTAKLLNILTGSDESTATYDPANVSRRRSTPGGHLLNQSA